MKKIGEVWQKLAIWQQVLLLSFLILGVGLIVRLVSLNVPAGITHDELDYVMNGKWLALTGRDLSGESGQWLKPTVGGASLTAELTAVIYSGLLRLVPFNLTGVRIVFSVIGSLLPVALFWWLLSLKVDRKIALLAGLLWTLSPWGLVFSHQAYEAPLSLLFLIWSLTATAMIERNKKLGANLLWASGALISACLTFYTYHGFKVLVFFALSVEIIYLLIKDRKDLKEGNLDKFWTRFRKTVQAKFAKKKREKRGLSLSVSTVILCVLWLSVLALTLITIGQRSNFEKRENEIIVFEGEKFADLSQAKKSQTLLHPANRIFESKYFLMAETVVDKAIRVFSPAYWFRNAADESVVLALWEHGWFYVIELAFFLIGLVKFSATKKKGVEKFLWFGLVATAILPAIIHSSGLVLPFRTALLIPLFYVMIALGIQQFINWFGQKYKLWGWTVVILLYLAVFVYWQWFYQNHYVIVSAQNNMLQERLLADYLKHAEEKFPSRPITIVSVTEPYHLVRAGIFYGQGESLNRKMAEESQAYFTNTMKLAQIQWENKFVSTRCEDAYQAIDKGELLIMETVMLNVCEEMEERLVFAYEDSYSKLEELFLPTIHGSWWTIFGLSEAELCSKEEASMFLANQTKKDYQIEKMDRAGFCRSWVIKN